jgi:hypothetical protein
MGPAACVATGVNTGINRDAPVRIVINRDFFIYIWRGWNRYHGSISKQCG